MSRASAILAIPFRHKRLLTSYGMVGITLTALYLCASLGLRYLLSMPAQFASPTAFLLCVPIAYLAQSTIVFQSRWLNAKQMMRFIVTMITGFAIATAAVPLLSWTLGLPEIISLLSVSLFVPIANFIIFRFWVFDGS